MKRTTIAYVDSSRDHTRRYVVIRRGNRFECTCLDFFFKENRDEPCRHIRQVLKTTIRPSAEGFEIKKLVAVDLTPKGIAILRERQVRQEKESADAKSKPAANSVEPLKALGLGDRCPCVNSTSEVVDRCPVCQTTGYVQDGTPEAQKALRAIMQDGGFWRTYPPMPAPGH